HATATTDICPLSLHDALPILKGEQVSTSSPFLTSRNSGKRFVTFDLYIHVMRKIFFYLLLVSLAATLLGAQPEEIQFIFTSDVRSEEPRLNSSHLVISYAVFC